MQVPSKPKKIESPDPKQSPPEKPSSPEEPKHMTTAQKNKENMKSMQRSNFIAFTDCQGDNFIIKTRVCGIDYKLTYDEVIQRWNIKKAHRQDIQPPELTPYIDAFHEITRNKEVAKKPAYFA